jgi:hypothetical protein
MSSFDPSKYTPICAPTSIVKRILRENTPVPNPDGQIRLPEGKYILSSDAEKLRQLSIKKRMSIKELGRDWVKKMTRRGLVVGSTGTDITLTMGGLDVVFYLRSREIYL